MVQVLESVTVTRNTQPDSGSGSSRFKSSLPSQPKPLIPFNMRFLRYQACGRNVRPEYSPNTFETGQNPDTNQLSV